MRLNFHFVIVVLLKVSSVLGDMMTTLGCHHHWTVLIYTPCSWFVVCSNKVSLSNQMLPARCWN